MGSINLGLEKPTSCPKPVCATKPGAICPFLEWYEELSLGFSQGHMCTRSCSESLCLRQGLPDWGERGLLFLSVPEPGSMVGRRDQSRQRGWRWGKSPAASDRKSWVLPLLFSFYLFPYLKQNKKKKSKQPQNSQGHLKKPNKALWQRPHSMPGPCSPELGAS